MYVLCDDLETRAEYDIMDLDRERERGRGREKAV